jgi:SAM-dependent methyltransferase
MDNLLDRYWYYAIEMAPGVITPGKRFPNVAITRDLLSRIDVKGQRCLDIGTMEALVPVILAKRGASGVVAVDGLDFGEKVAAVRAAHNVSFAYVPGVLSGSLVRSMEERVAGDMTEHRFAGGPKPRLDFDVVVLSGMLYHVHSPLHVLAAARSLLRPGGLMIVETAIMPMDAYLMQWNFAGSGYVYGPTDTWFMTVPLLDHFLRFLKMMPLDARWIPAGTGVARFACVARAVDYRPRLPAETLMEEAPWNLEHAALHRENLFPDPKLPPVPYTTAAKPVYRPGVGSCDLFATMQASQPLNVTPELIELRLGATI